MADDCTVVVRFSRESSVARIEGSNGTLKHCNPLSSTSSEAEKYADHVCHSFGLFYTICVAISIFTYSLDLALACLLLYNYYVQGYGLYFAVTLTFTLVPAILTTAVSLRWYIVDHDDPNVEKTSLSRWILRIVFLLLQMSLILRYIDTLIYGIRSKISKSTGNEQKQMSYYRRMLDEDTNSGLLRFFHSFLHAAPQAVIQLVFILRHFTHTDYYRFDSVIGWLQLWSVLSALTSVAWSLTTYHRSVRYARDDKNVVKWQGAVIAFLWHFTSAVSRILALSMLACVFPVWLIFICALHWGVMFIWLALCQQQTAACNSRCEELLLSLALGFAYVIAFISPRDGPTRYVYLAYYLVCFMENTAALVVWCVANNSSDFPYLYYGATILQVLCFLLSLAFLMLYYGMFHPSKTSIWCVKQPVFPLACNDHLSSHSDHLEKASFSKSHSYNVRNIDSANVT